VAIAFQINAQASRLFCRGWRKHDEGELLTLQNFQLPAVLVGELLQCLARRLASNEKRADHHHPGFSETGQRSSTGEEATHQKSYLDCEGIGIEAGLGAVVIG
jgi:hypothetical protein